MAKPKHVERFKYKKDSSRAEQRATALAEAANPTRSPDDSVTESDIDTLLTTVRIGLGLASERDRPMMPVTIEATIKACKALVETGQKGLGSPKPMSFRNLRTLFSDRNISSIGHSVNAELDGSFGGLGGIFGSGVGPAISRSVTASVDRFITERVGSIAPPPRN